MANNQMPLPDGEEIMSQAEVYRMLGVTRSTLRGFLDRGELRIADNRGNKGSVRIARSEVLRFMADQGIKPAQVADVPAQATGCARCGRWQEESDRKDETIRRLRSALAAATM
ncbi:helix-turn-helix domain-containing protein [Streptomyces sp. NPDC102264]|uniref:helix-turn-helix domain-containing protein n=1 Tax=Streptomyces sp. NPDC102264 TaxID=3366149 RepID=UPI00380D08A3